MWSHMLTARVLHSLRRRQALGHVPIIAEDLGVITPDVVALREAIGAPGMVVLQVPGPSYRGLTAFLNAFHGPVIFRVSL